MKKILVTHPVPPSCLEAYEKEFSITVPENKLLYEEILEAAAQYDGLFLVGAVCDAKLLDAAVNLKVVANFGVGYDNIDWKYATQKGIAVVNTPTQVTEATAEHCVALIMAAMRNISYYDRFVRKGLWDVPPFTDEATLIAGSVLGIAGFGRIGKKVCQKAQGLGMQVIYYDKYRADPAIEEEYGVTYCEMDELLRRSDCISLNMPYTPENHHFINEESFKLMKKSAYFVNGARGPVVDEMALVKALKEGWIKGAGLDVFENEPKVTPELLTLENVVMTPHIASATLKSRLGMAAEALDGIAGVLKGEKPYNVINPDVL